VVIVRELGANTPWLCSRLYRHTSWLISGRLHEAKNKLVALPEDRLVGISKDLARIIAQIKHCCHVTRKLVSLQWKVESALQKIRPHHMYVTKRSTINQSLDREIFWNLAHLL
jgi:16S rRNA A1518/A1519 N6-dimethyltransferase RsmA/KsgA/DIM1 with predicted DNA glycosylase/AP lyase activity